MYHVFSNHLDFINNSCTARNIFLSIERVFTVVKKYIRSRLANKSNCDKEFLS